MTRLINNFPRHFIVIYLRNDFFHIELLRKLCIGQSQNPLDAIQ